MVDRSPFDRIVAAGGYISVPAGSAPDGNSIQVPKDDAEEFHGRGGVHRLRRLRGRVPERVGIVIHGREDLASRLVAARAAGEGIRGLCGWCGR